MQKISIFMDYFLEIVFLEKQSKKLLCYFFNSVTIVIVK